MYPALFIQFFCDFHSFFAHPINPKRLVVFYIFQRLIHIFMDDFTKFQDNSRTKGAFFKFQEFSRTKVKFFQVCANPVSACFILYAISIPKFNFWIYVVVIDCRSLFSSTSCDIDLRSQSLKKCTHSRSPILFMVAFHICYVDTSWTLASHQMFPGHCDLDLWLQF